MNSQIATTTPNTETESALESMQSRLAALAVLGATLAALIWLTITVVRIATDAWVAPLHLSPQSDAVMQITQKLNRQKAEMARADAEVQRFDGELQSIGVAIERLSTLRHNNRASMKWQATLREEESQMLGSVLKNLESQRTLLQRLHERQRVLTEAAREDLKSGLIDRTELERQEQALDGLAISLADNERLLDEARQHKRQVSVSSRAYRAGLGEGRDPLDIPGGRMPEVAQTEEREARLELELLKLQAEERNLRTLRALALDTLAKERELLTELESRPLYRAVHGSTDIAFVPYNELEEVAPGGRVIACVWAVFGCREVGKVAEVLPGEVVTEGPWGEMTRGQYAILQLKDPEAIKEKLLRIRRE
jgi:hypothetical protein